MDLMEARTSIQKETWLLSQALHNLDLDCHHLVGSMRKTCLELDTFRRETNSLGLDSNLLLILALDYKMMLDRLSDLTIVTSRMRESLFQIMDETISK